MHKKTIILLEKIITHNKNIFDLDTLKKKVLDKILKKRIKKQKSRK